ncbi:YfhO family protein [Pontibacillus yanchengensis]|uniref:YfhO family protein n=1 Tax=Pontibacillus yanchengensis TaxID=462910 RepID=A0ACC7VIY0_9BACI|nr:YfhO family protein [Pontibacillus yanchengensis]MYL54136.1 YfhO family protein [Pontibacillus yanchengensis]
MNKRKLLSLLFFSLVIATLSHLFFLQQWMEGSYMAGPNDGLNQMLPFKQLIYENYTSGNFFYSLEFGFGGGFFGQLGYYFSTNLFFILTIIVVYLLEVLHIIDSPDVLFWAQATIFTSIIRMSLVIIATTMVFRYFSIRTIPAFIGASLYGASVIYFRHVTYWEFFADAFLFVPLLVFGIEKIIREQKPGWFIIAIAAIIFNNFYFAFINLLFVGIYILIRWFIPLQKKETSKLQQIKQFGISGLLGFGIGSIAFVPTIYAYFQNYRPAFNQERPPIDFSDNMLLDSRTFLLSTVVVLFLFVFSLYKHHLFRFFAALTLLFILFHFSPFMGSVFNGFSAPRHRFEYLGFFVAGGMVAAGIQLKDYIKRRHILISILLAVLAYGAFALLDQSYAIRTIFDQYMLVQTIIVIGAFVFISAYKRKIWLSACVIVLLANAGMMNTYQFDKLYKGGEVEKTTKEYILSGGYHSSEQQKLINRIQQQDKSFFRIDWKGTDDRNNVPIIQDFNGTSVYSSILNRNVLFWYYEKLEIDMKQESISRYSGFGNRANLYSLLRGKYIITQKEPDRNIPYGFKPYMESENYQVYRNTNTLPFARTSSQIYNEESMEDRSMVEREHAMLKGIILPNVQTDHPTLTALPNLMDQAEVEAVGGTYENGQLHITSETGGININLSSLPKEANDLYVSFHLKNNVKEAPWFPLHVNDFRTSRKSRESFYRTGKNDITIRVPKNQQMAIRVPEGSYTLNDLELYHQDYSVLDQAAQQRNGQPQKVSVNGNDITIQLNNEQNDQFLTIPVPYEKGWHVKVNGETKDIRRANYAFLGVELEKGENTISFTYYPPYFKFLVITFLLSLFLSIGWMIQKRKRPVSDVLTGRLRMR